MMIGFGGVASAQPFDEIGTALGMPVGANQGPLITGVSLNDFDGDGLPELVVTGVASGPVLYKRPASSAPYALVPGAFAVTSGASEVEGHTVFDMDGDGDLDVFFAKGTRPLLFENRSGVFVDVSERRLPLNVGQSVSAAAADMDGDGDLDLVVARYIDRADFPLHLCLSNQLFENDGSGRFRDVTAGTGFSAVKACSLLSAVTDVDGDGQLDIFFINDFGQYQFGQELWLNTGGLTYREASREFGFEARNFGMGLALGDVDENGRLDAVVTNIGEIAVLEQNALGVFADASDAKRAFVRYAADLNLVTWAAQFEDVDVDGYSDLVLAAGYLSVFNFMAAGAREQSVLMRGSPDGHFEEVPLASTFSELTHRARDIKFEDLDFDGRPEVVLSHINGRVTVYKNRNVTPLPTTLRLVPTITGKGAAGARLYGTCGGVARTRTVVGGDLYGSADRGVVRMSWPAPCDQVNQPVDLEVWWPSGLITRYAVLTGADLTLAEPAWLTFVNDPVRGRRVHIDLSQHVDPSVEVEVQGVGLVVGPLEPLALGVWEADVGVEAGAFEGRLDVRVDGELWGAHPKLRSADYVAPPILNPPVPIVGGLVDAWTVPGARVKWNNITVTADGDGRARLPVVIAAGPKVLELTYGNPARTTQWTFEVAPRASRERSELLVRDRIVKATDQATRDVLVRFRMLDANGALTTLITSDIGLKVDGVQKQIAATKEGDWFLIRAPHRDLREGAVLQPTVMGEAWFEPQIVKRVTDIADNGLLVDAQRSVCLLTEPRLWNDGQDRGTLVTVFLDRAGQRIPDFGQKPRWSGTNVDVYDGSAIGIGSFANTVRSGFAFGRTAASLGNQVDSVECVLPNVPRPQLPEVKGASIVDLGYGMPTVGVARPYRVVPLGPSGRALGSGTVFTVEVEGGQVSAGPVYAQLARYEAQVTPTGGSTMVIRVKSESGEVVAQATTSVYDPNPVPVEPEPEPVVEEVDVVEVSEVADADIEDTSVDEVGGDATEEIGPVPDVDGLDTSPGTDTWSGPEDDVGDVAVDATAGEDTLGVADAYDIADDIEEVSEADTDDTMASADAGEDLMTNDVMGGGDTAVDTEGGVGDSDSVGADVADGGGDVVVADSIEPGGDIGDTTDAGDVADPEPLDTAPADTADVPTADTADDATADTGDIATADTEGPTDATAGRDTDEGGEGDTASTDTTKGRDKGCEGGAATSWVWAALLMALVGRRARRTR
ncbi:MAG: VCBS repeat-containing protein [Deltaproteobacteria bacterium]|nr:VCBS repeat-containing protein [Deltaproteobacteria bacterium]